MRLSGAARREVEQKMNFRDLWRGVWTVGGGAIVKQIGAASQDVREVRCRLL